MSIDWADVVVPAVVAILVSPYVQYALGRRSDRAQGAFSSRKAFYDELLTHLAEYVDYVRYLPPNMRTPSAQPAGIATRQVMPTPLEIAMRLHASPTLRIQVNELLSALAEAKWQSDWVVRETERARGLPSGTFDCEWAYERATQHGNRKFRADTWAAQCLENIKFQMRYELYGWRRQSPLVKMRAKRSAKRIAAGQTDPLRGGGVPMEPPPGLREEWEQSRANRQTAPPPSDDTGADQS